MGQKIKPDKQTTEVPGAGAYNPDITKVVRNLPQYSMKAKLGSSLVSGSKGPGPGNYESHLKNKRDAPKFGFGSSTRDGPKSKFDSPGPGAYRINSSVGDTAPYAIPGKKDEQKYI